MRRIVYTLLNTLLLVGTRAKKKKKIEDFKLLGTVKYNE